MTELKKKTIKGWAVIWTEKARKEFGVKPNDLIIGTEPTDEDGVIIKAKKKGSLSPIDLYGSIVFREKHEAIAFKQKNKDWKVIPVKIKL